MAARRILVTGAGGAPGMNFIQSLREAPEPYTIFATDINRYHLQWLDVEKRFLVPPCDHPEYLEALNAILEAEEIDFVHPQPDVEVRALSEVRHKLRARTLLPSRPTVRVLQDKGVTGDLWERAGIRLKPTVRVESAESLHEAAATLGLPFWLRATTGAGARGSTLAENLETAHHWIAYWRSRGVDWEFIAEEYLPGRDFAWQSLWHEGRLITAQARERLEYIFPHLAPSGRTGTPIVARTCADAAVNDIAIRCVLAVDPKATGVFSVDLREDRDGRPIPTEINCGRFFTTSLFFTRAGLNMPHLYVKLAFGEDLGEVPQLNPLPTGLHWIRHIDCPTVLVPEHALMSDEGVGSPALARAA